MIGAPRVRSFRNRSKIPVRIGMLLLVFGIYSVWQARKKIPTSADAGATMNGETPTTRPNGDSIRVATFNIDGKDGMDTIRTMIGFDLIGLQEVHVKGFLSGPSQAETLGTQLKMPWLFAPVEHQWWRDCFGDGALTTLPVEHWQRFPLAGPTAGSNREVLILRLTFAGKPLNVLITHLSRDDDRENEFASVVNLFLSMQDPSILMGDFNSKNDDPQIKLLRTTPGVIDPVGDAVIAQNQESWDRIFAKGMRGIKAGLIDKGASDHPLAWAELKLAGSNP